MTGKRGPGGYVNPIKEAWALRFGFDIHKPKAKHIFLDAVCWQLCQCRTDEARRLILGVSK